MATLYSKELSTDCRIVFNYLMVYHQLFCLKTPLPHADVYIFLSCSNHYVFHGYFYFLFNCLSFVADLLRQCLWLFSSDSLWRSVNLKQNKEHGKVILKVNKPRTTS